MKHLLAVSIGLCWFVVLAAIHIALDIVEVQLTLVCIVVLFGAWVVGWVTVKTFER
jgi:hypothetical protein